MDSFEEYYQKQIDDGYIQEDGYPLKCQFCDSTNLDWKCNLEEKEVKCHDCGKLVGYWAYGNWTV